jgi:hypothetical protein
MAAAAIQVLEFSSGSAGTFESFGGRSRPLPRGRFGFNVRGDRWIFRRDQASDGSDPESRSVRRHRSDHRRERHGKGTDCPRGSQEVKPFAVALHFYELRATSTVADSGRLVRPRKGRLHWRQSAACGRFEVPATARSSWMKSEIFQPKPRSPSCGCFRSVNWSESGAAGASRLTFAS